MNIRNLIFAVLLISLISCGSSDRRKLIEEAPLISQELTDDTGRKIRLPSSPEKVISIAPNITEIVFAIGAEKKLVARSQACNYPPSVEDIPSITTYPALDLEEIQARGGDLLITTDEIFSPQDIELLQRINTPIYLQSYKKIEDVFRCIKDMGTILSVEDRAVKVADSLESIVSRVKDSTENLAKYQTVILISSNPLKVVGGQGFLNEMLQLAGGKNAYGSKENPYPETTVEELLFLKPEILILPSNNQQVYAELLALYPDLQDLPASITKQVYMINPDYVYRPGPRMITGLLEMTNILHSKLTPQLFIDAE